MINDEYQHAIEYLANEIVKRLNRKKLTTDEQQSQITDDLDAICEDIADGVLKTIEGDEE